MTDDSTLRRRDAIGVVATTALGLAGCLAGGGSGTGEDDHAALRGIDRQPTLGPPPGEAAGTIVAFEDPSCPRCRRFARDTVPEIRSDLVDPGRATFVSRPYPVVYDWGEPASKSLLATVDRDADAFWPLQDHYYDEQDAISTDDVLDRTRAFLDEGTDVDGTAVVEAVEAGEADPGIETNLDAGEAAGATATPAVFLFRDGEFRTKASGSVSYDAIESALGL